MIMLK